MATRDTGQGASGISRRDFLKASAAATAVVGCGLEFAYDPAKASAYEAEPGNYQITTTTCPYCSASCGQRVVVDLRATVLDADGLTIPNPKLNEIIDIYGDFESPMNSGGLCSKGAGGLQLANNPRRIGAYPAPHPLPNNDGTTFDDVFAAKTDAMYSDGIAYTRVGDGNWSPMPLATAMGEIAQKLVDARGWGATAPADYNGKGVAFFGCSHMNNESNYMYRKLIANFGSSNVEHQARI